MAIKQRHPILLSVKRPQVVTSAETRCHASFSGSAYLF